MKKHTTIAITKELACRIDKQGAIMGSDSRSSFATFLIKNALNIIEENGIDKFLAAKDLLKKEGNDF